MAAYRTLFPLSSNDPMLGEDRALTLTALFPMINAQLLEAVRLNVRITPVWHDILKSQNHLFGKPGAPGPSAATLLQARQVA